MERSKEILMQMTLAQKASLVTQYVLEHTDVSEYGLENILLADGPSGIRMMKADSAGIYDTVPLTCYPSASTCACSWDRELMGELGRHLGMEAQDQGVSVLLGPGCNIKRSPLGGRNFEYYSEDPCLTGELALAYIRGLQGKHVGACIKHFAANNQETRRMTINELIDERTLHEIYLKAFEKPIREGKPYMVMAGYNRINGEYCAESDHILKGVLREDWGYEGNVITDCFGAHDLPRALKNGLNIEMTALDGGRLAEIIAGYIKEGRLTEDELDRAVLKTIDLMLQCAADRTEESYDPESHHEFAARLAQESMVLLKNEDSFFPLAPEGSLAVIGEMAVDLRFQGGGSSHVNPYRLDQCFDKLKEIYPQAVYAPGYSIGAAGREKLNGGAADGRQISGGAADGRQISEAAADGLQVSEAAADDRQISDAVALAAASDRVVLFLGLPEIYESEGYDRTHMRLPAAQELLLEKVLEVNSNVGVVLFNGAPVEMPWLSRVKAVLEAYLPGEAGGTAVARLLSGRANPCGRLAETFPVHLEDTPCFLNFPGGPDKVHYREGIYVGYRYYEKCHKPVNFPFGYGLSYTTFEYSRLNVEKNEKHVQVSLEVKNTGALAGKETVQLYVSKPSVWYDCPVRELADFTKVDLQPGETKKVDFALPFSAFMVYDEDIHAWVLEGGSYTIAAGRSAGEMVQSAPVELPAWNMRRQITIHTMLQDMIVLYNKGPQLKELLQNYPESMKYMSYCYDEDPLIQSMGTLMSFHTLRRADPELSDKAIDRIIEALNQ